MFLSRARLFTISCALLVFVPSTFAAITLELRPSSQTVTAGTAASVGLYVVSDLVGGEPVGKINAIIQFDPNRMTLLGHDLTGAPAWGAAEFPSASSLNPDWTNGTALFSATSGILPFPCGTLEVATPAGLLVTTFLFDIGPVIGSATVLLPATLSGETTEVYDALTILTCGGLPYPITLGPTVILNVVTCGGAVDCNDGTACTDDLCTAGVCSNPDNYDPVTLCCNPANGATLTIDDGNDCTRDLCDSTTGAVSNLNENFGVACGDTLTSSCTQPDTCDGMGVCQNNDQNDGTPCAEQNMCIADGSCLSGVCSNPTAFSMNGSSCDDGNFCTELDVCTNGVCDGSNPCSGVLPLCFENVGGFICGNCSNRSQCPPDIGCVTWDCLTTLSHICAKTQDNVLCDDNLFCTGDDTCLGDGTCTNNGSPCLTGAICDEANTACIECIVDTDCKRCDVSGDACLDTIDCPVGEMCLTQTNLCDPIVCNAGICEPGAPVNCPQTEQCLINECNAATGACEQQLPGSVACTAGTCPVGFSCDTVQDFVCFRSAGCTDADGCTLDDMCVNGACVGTPRLFDQNVDMQLVPVYPAGRNYYMVGETAEVQLRLKLNNVSTISRSIGTVGASLSWDPLVLGGAIAPTIVDPCTGTIDPLLDCPLGQYDWSGSVFSGGVCADGAGLSGNLIDGDAMYCAAAALGAPQATVTTTQDLWVTSFMLPTVRASSTTGSRFSMVPCVSDLLGGSASNSRVLAGADRTGNLLLANVRIQCTVNAQCDDGDPCTLDSCNQATSFCQFLGDATLAGIACGDGSSTDCDNPDTCDAMGICQLNNEANGFACTDDGIDCTNDVCGSAVCTHPNKVVGSSCGDPTAIECNAADSCDGIGNCLANLTTDGTACSSDGNNCTDDVCQFGLCLNNNKPNGTNCVDSLFCTDFTTCDAGVCQGGQVTDCGDGVACTIDTCDENTNSCVNTPDDGSCSNGAFCDGDEVCNVTNGCQAGPARNCDDGVPCTADSCNAGLNQCDNIADDMLCDNGLFCDGVETCDVNNGCQSGSAVNCTDDGVACTVNDFCDEMLDACSGIANDTLCAMDEICDLTLGCVPAVTCNTPIVTAVGSRFFSVEPLPADSNVSTRFFITSPTWPCLAKFVGVPVGVDLDANGTIDGMAATLVDVVNDAGVLTPAEWSGFACSNLSPTCMVDGDCGVGGSCDPIMRCSESLQPCAITPDCPMGGETCVPGKLYVGGPDITPSDRNQPPTQYRIQADCGGGQPPIQTVQMHLFGDTDRSGIINATDITLAVQGFQLNYHLPVGEFNGSLTVSVDHRGTATVCSIIVPLSINVADITATVKSFQLATYASEAVAGNCPLPCP